MEATIPLSSSFFFWLALLLYREAVAGVLRRRRHFSSSRSDDSALMARDDKAVGVPKYTQNETASFQRKHKAHDPLSFDRGNIQLQAPSRILSGQELVAKLKEEEEERRKKAEEKEQLEVHPQERDQKDDYVNEVANKEEKDYKEFD
ncbi:unnamed protein product [Caenorhabditis auriculariae]|uniref:Uncharacterized protein n=1 Tax=Caenorhabditis auriculariae TaxID=2777116 RepID=A0A8S1H2Y0_9PELO|nr:unnamed protein product [Caenorhabditis auriculariae]